MQFKKYIQKYIYMQKNVILYINNSGDEYV